MGGLTALMRLSHLEQFWLQGEQRLELEGTSSISRGAIFSSIGLLVPEGAIFGIRG